MGSVDALTAALCVMPSRVARSASIDARWLAAADLAAAIGARLDGCDVLTPYGLFPPAEIREWALRPGEVSGTAQSMARRLPRSLRLLSGDIRMWEQARKLRPLTLTFAGRYGTVLQFHRRFQDLGLRIARSSDVPFVLRLEALEVREEHAWGRSRPVFGGFVERNGELAIIRQADLVLPVSKSLELSLLDEGIPPEKLLVMPNGVDLDLFSPGPADEALRLRHGLEDRFVIGWIGGFRPFHGLELLRDVVESLRTRIPDAVLCLVGTGPLRGEVEHQLRGLEHWVRIVDAVPRDEIPRWIRTFDVCLLLAAGQAFHYSPLKLYEYMACGRAVIAANAGQVSEVLEGSDGGVLVPPGDVRALVDALEALADDAGSRERMGSAARLLSVRSASWDLRVTALLENLGTRGLLSTTNDASPGRLSVGEA
jgi:glycosyltransferase involved in cell wall biosynthesis